MNTEQLGIRKTGLSTSATLASQEENSGRYVVHAKIYRFLTNPEPSLALQTVTFMIAILITCILIAIPD